MIKKFFLPLLLVLAIGFFFRFYRLEEIPFGLNHDGAQDALQSIYLIDDLPNYHPFLPGGSGETLFKYYLGLVIKCFGPSSSTIKFASSLICFLTIPFFYLFVREISDRKLALFSTFLLAVSGWHIIMGKTVWRAITTPFFEVITFLFLFKAIHKKKYLYYLLSGFFLGLTFHTYNGARSVVIFCFLFFLYFVANEAFHKKNIRQYLIGFCFFVVSFAAVSFPLIKYAFNNWSQFNSRLDSLSVFSRIRVSQNLTPLLENVQKSFLIFNVKANGDDFFISQPLLDCPSSFLFLFGLIFCLFRIKSMLSQFLLFGILVNLLPGFISVPNGNRNIATMPFVYIVAGLGFLEIWNFACKNFSSKILPFVLIAVVCINGLFNTYSLYFGSRRQEIWGFYPETTIVGNFMKDKLDRYDFYIADNFPRDALTFLTYTGGNPFTKHYVWFEDKNSFLDVSRNRSRGIIFIMFDLPENRSFLHQLERKYSDGIGYALQYKSDVINRSAALVFQVPQNENQ